MIYEGEMLPIYFVGDINGWAAHQPRSKFLILKNYEQNLKKGERNNDPVTLWDVKSQLFTIVKNKVTIRKM